MARTAPEVAPMSRLVRAASFAVLGFLLLFGVPIAWMKIAYARGGGPTVPAFLLLSAITACLGGALLRLIDRGQGSGGRADLEEEAD